MSNYSNNFYNTIRQGCIDSANTVAPLVQSIVAAKSVIDIGCGEGHWAKAFEDLGADVVGVDGSYVDDPVVSFIPADLSRSLPPLTPEARSFDLAISLEVAEHLPARRANSFVADLCRLSDNILFSAAIPGQGGTDHINEQWPQYWVEKFAVHGYGCSDFLRWQFWEDNTVQWWYRQNLILAVKDDPIKSIAAVVHPMLWSRK